MTVAAAAAIELPPTSAWFFFVLHLIAGATHLTSTALLILAGRKPASVFLRLKTRIFGMMAHGGGAVLHFYLGYNSFFGGSLRNPDGTVPWYSMLLILIIAIGLPMYLINAQRDILTLHQQRGVPRE